MFRSEGTLPTPSMHSPGQTSFIVIWKYITQVKRRIPMENPTSVKTQNYHEIPNNEENTK